MRLKLSKCERIRDSLVTTDFYSIADSVLGLPGSKSNDRIFLRLLRVCLTLPSSPLTKINPDTF
jgi:hypothetical protein